MDFNDLIVRLMSAIRRRRMIFLLLFVAIFAGAVGGAYIKPARFESTATLLITLQSSRVKTTPFDRDEASANLQPEEIMAAQVEIMQAREVTEELVDTLPEWVFVSEPSDKWYVQLIVVPLKEAVDWVKEQLVFLRLIEPENERYSRIRTIEKGLTVYPVRKAQVIEITFQSKDPRVPPVVIENLIDIYKNRSRELLAESQGVELYHERALQLSEELAKAEAARTAFLLEHDIIDFDSERQQLIQNLQSRRLKADEERLMELVSLEPQLNLLTRNVGILAESYSIYRQAADDRATFFERDNEISAQVIDPPSVIYTQYTRSRLTLVLIGLGAALVLALILVLLMEWISSIRRVYRPRSFDTHRTPRASPYSEAAE